MPRRGGAAVRLLDEGAIELHQHVAVVAAAKMRRHLRGDVAPGAGDALVPHEREEGRAGGVVFAVARHAALERPRLRRLLRLVIDQRARGLGIGREQDVLDHAPQLRHGLAVDDAAQHEEPVLAPAAQILRRQDRHPTHTAALSAPAMELQPPSELS